ncbi:MAG: flagellar biosynthetic protein FliR [Ammonifex sp.]|nr:MAG: flagellar biosynthetic protein FliR [Ammonifex sp.]
MDFGDLSVFLMVFARIAAFAAVFPLFALTNIPVQVRVGFGFVLALAVTPVVAHTAAVPGTTLGYTLDLAGEILIGLGVGYTAGILFHALRIAGQFIGLQIGFAAAELLDFSGTQNTILAELMFFTGVIVFFALNAHHAVLAALVRSFELIPLTGGAVKASSALIIARFVNGMFATALQLSAPILAVMVVVDVSLGILVRMVPQINVFMLGFPLKITTGLILLACLLPVMGVVLEKVFERMVADVFILVRGLA